MCTLTTATQTVSMMVSPQSLQIRANSFYLSLAHTTLVAVIHWKHHNSLYDLGPPQSSGEGLDNIYKQLVDVDAEIKRAYERLPPFLRSDPDFISAAIIPSHVKLQASVTLLSTAHKVKLSIIPPIPMVIFQSDVNRVAGSYSSSTFSLAKFYEPALCADASKSLSRT